jgi:predicted ATPase/DNA-binding XRE family transcriptional regulator
MSTSKPQASEEDFAALLKRRRTAAGLTQAELAEKAGLSERAISDWERRLKRPQRENVRMLMKALELSPADAAEFLAASTPATATPLDSLPAPRTSLIGREDVVQAVRRVLTSGETRLLTLIGPGGVGKTRIALYVAAELKETYRDGAAFVSLAPIVDPDLAPGAVLRALGVANTAGRPVADALHAWLRPRKILLVLDNCEQAPFGPFVAALLAASPGLVVLATSRAPLHVTGEQERPVAPLGLVDPDRLPPLPELSQVAAVKLFVARARAVRPDFTLTPANAAAVAAICVRLDGLPLAIELAAARIKTLSPAALIDLLADRLKILTGAPVDAPARHQTMRAAIAWSAELLGEVERAAFRRFAVFSGGCALDEAVAVIGAGDLDAALRDLTALVDQSLVRRDEDRRGESRFVMLETIRAFATEQLGQNGEETATRARHAAAYLALAERAAPLLVGADSVAWLDRLESEHDNLWAALNWFLDRQEAEEALRLTRSLWRWWWRRGRLREGRDWLMRALSCGGNASPETLSNALNVLGNINSDLGRYQDARTAYEASLALRRQIGEPFPIAASLHNLGIVTGYMGDYDRARSMVEEALEIKRRLPDQDLFIALALMELGEFAYCAGDYPRAKALHEENLEIVQRLGDSASVAYASYYLGRALRPLDAASARRWLEQSLKQFHDLNDTFGESYVLPELARLAIEQEDDELAESLYRDGLRLAHGLGGAHLILVCLEGLAELAARQTSFFEAARLFGAAHAGRRRLGRPLPLGERANLEMVIHGARSEFGPTMWDEAWRAGTKLRIDDVAQDELPS